MKVTNTVSSCKQNILIVPVTWPTESRLVDYKVNPSETDGMDVLGLVVFSIVFGLIIGRMGDTGKILIDFFQAIHEAIVKMVMMIIW